MPATSDGELLNLECEIQAPTEQRCTHLHFFGLQFDEVDKLFTLFAHAIPDIVVRKHSSRAQESGLHLLWPTSVTILD